MKVATPVQMNEIDRMTINGMGIPGVVLMENAALKVFEEVDKILGVLSRKTVIIFAGKGNNGGDGFAVARHLFNKDTRVIVYIVLPKKDIKGDAGINLDIIENMGVEIIELDNNTQVKDIENRLIEADLIIDGIFGTGLKGDVSGVIRSIIEAINGSGKHVLSIDIPSGLSGETGKVLGECIKAHKTVTFALPKVGLVIQPGCEYTGELIVADIGVPRRVIDSVNIKVELIDKGLVSSLIPSRHSETNKGDYGKIFIVTGSLGMTGAGCLTAGAALRTGAGLVYLGVPASLTSIYDTMITESITLPLDDGGSGYLKKEGLELVLKQLDKSTAAAVGPGLSVSDDIIQLVSRIIEYSKIPLILDADALNAISKDVEVLKKLRCEAILTPHPGEMSRLTGLSIEEIQHNRLEVACEFAKKWGVITVLKGYRTIVAAPGGKVFINPTGNSGMATGGTGDVLTGIIAGLVGQGIKPLGAAVAGVFLHGLSGDSVAETKGKHGLTAGDLVNEIPYAIKQLLLV
ncbi:MAG: NAD(P)H-hydrate dehydratase [Clostridia bacterium]|nr:NAD(P)H-hydrate dehydratase [Clostridia bacterium]